MPFANGNRFWGGLLGLVAVAFSVQLTAAENRAFQIEEQDLRGRRLAIALHAEIVPLAKEITAVSKSAKEGVEVAKRTAEIAEEHKVKLECKGGREILRGVRPLGVFEAAKGDLGLLPDTLAYHFVRLHAVWRDFNEEIDSLPPVVICSRSERVDLKLIQTRADLMLLYLGSIDKEMKRLGFAMQEAPGF